MRNGRIPERYISYDLLKSKGYEFYKEHLDDENVRKALLAFENLIDSLPYIDVSQMFDVKKEDCRDDY